MKRKNKGPPGGVGAPGGPLKPDEEDKSDLACFLVNSVGDKWFRPGKDFCETIPLQEDSPSSGDQMMRLSRSMKAALRRVQYKPCSMFKRHGIALVRAMLLR